MKKTILILLICFCVILFYACDKCRYLDCSVTNTSAQFRIISKTNGYDLVFGNNSIYDKNKIKFFSLNGNDTVFFQYSPESRYLNDTRDSILKVYYLTEPKGLTFIKLSNTDVDTLTMTYLTENTKCCGVVTTISKFIYNNTNDIGGNGETRELKK
jgi:hypothetical protein